MATIALAPPPVLPIAEVHQSLGWITFSQNANWNSIVIEVDFNSLADFIDIT